MNYAKKVVSNTFIVLFLKSLGILSMLLTNAILARMMTQEEYGVYFLFVSTVLFFALAIRLGQRQAVVRLVSESITYNNRDEIVNITLTSIKLLLSGAVVLFIMGLLGLDHLLDSIFSMSEISSYSVVLFVWVLLLAMEMPIVETLRGLHKIWYSTIFDNLLSYIFLLLALLIYYAFNSTIELRLVLILTLASVLISLMMGFFVLKIQLKGFRYIKRPTVKRILRISFPLLLVNLSNFTLNNSGIWISGYFLDQESVAVYGAAWKFVNIIIFPLMIVSLAVQPIVVELFTSNKITQLEKIMRGSATLLAFPALILTILLIVYGESLLGFIYGDSYMIAYNVLIVLTFGQLINVLTGQSITILGLCGHQKPLMYISLASVILSVVLSSYLVDKYGLMGVSIGVTIGLISSNITSAILVNKLLRIKIYPTMNPRFIKEAYLKVTSKA
jgi:O-antigen/teichoic acid export membrane protein